MAIDNEELKQKPLLPCPSCWSENVSVRVARYGWYYVGCNDCWNKRECDESCLDETIEFWNRYAEKVMRNQGRWRD